MRGRRHGERHRPRALPLRGRRRAGVLALLALAIWALLRRPPAAEPAPATAPPPAPATVAAEPVRRPPAAALLAAASMVVPGAGQLLAGRRRRGLVWIAAAAALVLVGVLVLSRGGTFLAEQVTRPKVLIGLLAANGAILLLRGWSAVDAWRLGRRPAGRPARAAALGAVLAVAAAPHAVAGWYDWTAYDTITTVFADAAPASIAPGLPFEEVARAARRPAPPPWPGRDRLTVLLLGGDAGPGRSGLRTDTMVVATIDVRSGRAALMSLPRNLARVPLPPAVAGLEPGGVFPDILNALYGWATDHADRFPGRDPGASALKEVVANITGMRIDYYALVDFRGFVEVVDALGGVTVDVPVRVLDRVSPPEDGEDWIRIDLSPGVHHLDAREAFAYVRARSQSSDYARIGRQRCVLTALARQAGAGRLLRAFPRLARAARDYVHTDIPRRALPDLVRLLGRIDAGRIVSVGFTPPAYTAGWVGPGYPVPDIPEIRAAAHRAATAVAPARAASALGGGVCG